MLVLKKKSARGKVQLLFLFLFIFSFAMNCESFTSPETCNYSANKFCVEIAELGNAELADVKDWCEYGGGKYSSEGCPEKDLFANCDNITDEDYTKMIIDDTAVGTLANISYRFYTESIVSPYSETDDKIKGEAMCKESGGKYSKVEE